MMKKLLIGLLAASLVATALLTTGCDTNNENTEEQETVTENSVPFSEWAETVALPRVGTSVGTGVMLTK